ncbi:MAG: TRM11 family SAM-dependent methyltransferase [Gammaproteobacteria bacterium]
MDFQRLVDAINFTGVVSGLTHDFYRYPARFSPLVARAAIESFTLPGNTILDPFSGGGTSLVEALALGRHAVGVDISRLAVYLAKVKTLLLDEDELDIILDWAIDVTPDLSPRKPVERHWEWKEAGYQENLPWRFRKVAEQAINSAGELPDRLQPIARCVVLRTVQWGVDCKKRLPTAAEFRARMVEHAVAMTHGLKALAEKVRASGQRATIEAFHGPADEIGTMPSKLLLRSPPKLVVTSPPYPGTHVLYHRWQVFGRRETSAPFWIADCQDGQGSAFYTFGDRRNQKHEKLYFGTLLRTFIEIRKVVSDDAYIVQLVGFGKPNDHIPLYRDAMREAGFKEHECEGHRPSQFWRSVPNRKWYTWLRDETKQTSEVLLVHRPA